MKLLRTIRLDPSDTFVFERAAEPGEWAVSGAFMFWEADPAAMEGKERAAFRSGFLGVASLGWSTLVQIVEASDDDRLAAIDTLARHLVAEFGAPSVEEAVAAAEEEFAFAASLCDHPHDMLIAVHRTVEDGADPRSVPHAAPARRAEAHARVLVPGGRGRGGAGRDGGPQERSDEDEQAMTDFWLSCGHHLLDRDEGGGLLVTDEFSRPIWRGRSWRRRRRPAWSSARCTRHC